MLTPLLHLLIALLVALQVGVLPIMAAAFDNSEYRVNTYGTSSLYCDLTLSIASPSGSGTFADPWNATRCLSAPVAGNIVRVKSGVSQPIITTDNDNIPVFQPANSGTVGNPIVYVTQYASVALAGVATNANRTELRHSGVAPTIVSGVGAGDGAAMLGGNGKNYIIYDGFYIDVTQAYPKEDSGIIRDESTIGMQFKNIYIKGATLTLASNAVVWRPDNSLDTVLYNIKTVDFVNDGTGSATPQPSGWADAYGAMNFSLRHFEISNCGLGLFLKGSANAGAALNYGLIEYGYIDGGLGGVQLHALHGTNLTTVRYVRVSNYTRQGFFLSNEVVEAQNILIDYVTAANGATDLGGADGGALYSVRGGGSNDVGFATNLTFRNSIFDSPVTAASKTVNFDELVVAEDVFTANYNGYMRGANAASFGMQGTTDTTIAAWRSRIGQDANSLIIATEPFVNRAGGDFTISPGHAVKTASSTGGEIGAYAGTETVGLDLTEGGGSSGAGRFNLFMLRR